MERITTLEKGRIIDRYRKPSGSFVADYKTPFPERSLPSNTDLSRSNYHKYKILSPLHNVQTSRVAPWFNQLGGGIQHKLPQSVEALERGKYLREIRPIPITALLSRVLGFLSLLLMPNSISPCQDLDYMQNNPRECGASK